MKPLFLILTLFFTALVGLGEEINSVHVTSKIDEVTVFLTGGEVKRSASVRLKKGRNKLIFKRLSTVIDNKSVQFNASNPLNLVSVSSEIDYLNFITDNPRIEIIKDTIALLNKKIDELINEKQAYYDEKDLLRQNKKIKGKQDNLTVEELSAMATFFRERNTVINKAITEYDKKINELTLLNTSYQNQLTALNYNETVKSNQIIVIVDSDSDQQLDVTLKYIVSNCGWQANYDLRASSLKDEITLRYKAKVYNNTGNDWKNVELFLSTSDPNLSASEPKLEPWYLNYYALINQTNDDYSGGGYVVPKNRAYKKYYQNSNAPQMSQNLDGLFLNEQQQLTDQITGGREASMQFNNIEVSQLSTTFDIKKSYSIPSDSKPYLVEITDYNLTASFSHKAVPKLDKDAFLLANIVGWEDLDLVPGPTQVYFSASFVGQSFINTSNVGDTLRLSFGRDLKIPVTRKLMKEYSDKKVIGNNRKDTYTYKIIAKNNREVPVKLSLYDQIPISQDSDISVQINEISDADYNETTGKLEWLLQLKPGESKAFQISFTLKYPKDKTIRVQKYRTISAPSF